MKIFKFSFLLLTMLLSACSSNTSIFPAVDTNIDNNELITDYPGNDNTDRSTRILLNPIDIIVDEANSQLVVINSNLRLSKNDGSILTLEVAVPANLDQPSFTLNDIILTPSFATQTVLDNNILYVPFREQADFDDDDDASDRLYRYEVANNGDLTLLTEGTTGVNPFGITLFNNELFVVTNHELYRQDALDLTNVADTPIDLDLGNEQGNRIDNSDGGHVDSIAIDTVRNLAFITNRKDNMLVVDLDLNRLTHVIDGRENTRAVRYDATNDKIYFVDGNPGTLFSFDPAVIDENPADADDVVVLELDDSEIIVGGGALSVGVDPNGMAIDEANNRGYVVNTDDRTLTQFSLNPFSLLRTISLDEDDTNLDNTNTPYAVAVGDFTSANNEAVTYVFVADIINNNIIVVRADTFSAIAAFPKLNDD
jgi:hypothetical protein